MIKISEVLNPKEKDKNNFLFNFYLLQKIWQKAMLPKIVEVTTPQKITKDNVLHILVHDNIWHTELTYLKDDIIAQLSKYDLHIKNIKFINAPYMEKYKNPPQKKNIIGERELFYIEKCSKFIDNEKIKKSFENAMKAYFEKYSFEEFING